MTHILVVSGTPSGGTAPAGLTLDTFENQQSFPNVLLQYVGTASLILSDFVNTNTFPSLTLQSITVSLLTLTDFTDADTFPALTLVELPFVPANAETTALLAVFTGTYSTSLKIQIDTFITNLKAAGIWTKLDWLYVGRFAVNEHDSLINWVDPAKTLTIHGTPTFEALAGWTGKNSFDGSRLKSNWNIGDGPHSTSTDMCVFVRIDNYVAPENGMCLAGLWIMSSPGPAAPIGTFFVNNKIAGDGFAGVNALPFTGNTGYSIGDGLGQFAVSRNGGTQKVFKNGTEIATGSISGSAAETHVDGLALLGATKINRSFNGRQAYGGWGSNLTNTELAAIENGYQNATLPPGPPPPAYETPSYSNLGGTGRRPFLTVTTNAALGGSSGAIDRLLDGGFENDNGISNDNGSIWFASGQTLREIKFDFRTIAKQVIQEAKWYQSDASTHGSWKWQGSNDDTTYTDIGSAFTLGGVAGAQIHTQLGGNTTPYNFYKLVQTSGVTSSSPWNQEIEFKLGHEQEPAASVPSYLHSRGLGDRTALITITTDITTGAGTPSNLVDGDYSYNATGAFQGSVAQSARNITFDMGVAILVTEAQWVQNTASAQGTWKWQGSADNVSYTDIGGTFTLNHGTLTTLSGNVTSYRYYRMLQTAGATNSTTWDVEINFKCTE